MYSVSWRGVGSSLDRLTWSTGAVGVGVYGHGAIPYGAVGLAPTSPAAACFLAVVPVRKRK